MDKDFVGVSSRLATRYGPPAVSRGVVDPLEAKRDEIARDWAAWEQWLIDGGAF